MSLPDDLLDELLSAHLDDALSGDERARVEQMLLSDPAISQRLSDLSRQRDSFRLAAFTTPKLPDGFADQVVQAAIARAQVDELRSDHPLQLAARDAMVTRSTPGAKSKFRMVATVVGLAASVLFAGFAVERFTRERDHSQTTTTVASITDPSISGRLPDPDQPAASNPGPALASVPKPEGSGSKGASDSGTAMAVAAAADSVPPESPLDDTIPDQINRRPLMKPDVSDRLLADAGGTKAAVPDTADSNAATSLVEMSEATVKPLNMLMVIEIKQSEQGRRSAVFDQALASVQIESGDERQVDQQLARAITSDPNTPSVDDRAGRVLLLESPAKKLDRLVTQLVTQSEGIEAIGFSVISVQFDAPLLRSIESVRTVDPTKIRHQGQAIPIVSSSEEVFDAWVSQLGNRSFIPVNGPQEAQALTPMSSVDNGPDQMANILFLVR